MTLPTKLTCLRIVLTFVIMACLFLPGGAAKAAALAGFLLASLTDWLDGHLARRWRQASPLGALLDPIADKVLVLGLFLAFVQLRLVPAWMVLIIALREFLITGVRLLAASRRVVLAAAKEGKHKTASQMATILLILVALLVRELVAEQALPPQAWDAIDWLILACLWITMVLTVASGTTFFWRHRTVLRDVVTQ
jgi:CDP-diacylglycerol--glycerol-3-phosphate 3-phosphatidyltransferase